DTFSYEPSRYDIGDGNGSVFDYVRSTCSHDKFIEALNALETQLYFPGVPEDIKKDVETIVEKQSAILKENLKEKIANLDKAQNEYKELHKKWLIEATEADRIDELLKNSLNEIKDTYDNSIKAIYKDVLEQRSYISSYEENSEVRRFISNEAKKMIVSELYLPSRDAQKAMNSEDYKTYNSIDWAKLRRIWEKFPSNVNMDSYTTELLNSVCEEHSINQKEEIENIKIVDNTQETISNETELTQEDIDLCKKVIPPAQFKFTMELTEGEEGEFFKNKMKEIADTYRRINTDRELINKDGTHQLGFRYFLGNTEIMLSEIDSEGIGFGYTILNGDLQMSEWGSTSLEEIMKIPYIEMDYHVPEGMTIERMLYQEHPEYFSEYAPENDNDISFEYDEFTEKEFTNFVKEYSSTIAVGKDGGGNYLGRIKSGKVHTDIHIRDNGISLEHYYPKDDSDYGEYEGKNGKFYYESYPGFLLREESLKDIDISNCTYDEFISFISKECIDSMKDNEEVFEAAKGPIVSWEDIATEKGNALKPYNFFVSDSQNLDLGLFQDFDTITGLSAEQAALKYAELKDKGLSPYIGLNIPGDRIFDDKEGQGAGIFTEMEGTPSFYIGDSFVKGLKVNDEHTKNVIAAYKELYEATNKYILGVEKPSFVFEKEEELNRPAEPLKVYTFSPFGYEGMVVQVETDIRKGIPAFDIVGIADSAVKETRERIRAAFSRSGLEFPSERVLQALSPADLRKDSPMDLAMALGILGTTKAYPVGGPVLALGELELSGRIRPVRGAVAAVNSAKALGITNIVCDPSTAELLKNIEGINILSAESLKEVDEKLMVAESFEKTNAVVQDTDEVQFNEEWMEDYKEAIDNLPMDGHFETIRAIEIAVAGKHNILATGAPGCGKTLLTQTLMPALTPKMTEEESRQITRIN
ncbi:MAG: ATP-binding protein, partial [Clostridia bacterium]|nr:ATP-binding protein [Clostridia bacterium]